MKIVVVADGSPVTFEGEKISAFHDDDGYLIVNDLTSSPPKKVGAFRSWDYWCYTEQVIS